LENFLLHSFQQKDMSNSVYQINKGINRSIEFKGLKAQYIWYLGGGLVVLLILFAILYISGLGIFICLPLIAILATALFMRIYKLSRTYGEYGMMKKIARRSVPDVVKSYSKVKLKKILLNEKSE
jgi:hypothetical protein